ncbi:MAG: hypothetical protein IKE58_10495 [Blautia sp.]|nr:hypothetical protein [Blautia sp.]MBR6350435.1 hypothetical protein [Lachnospiraceae bacterium]
MSQREFNDEMYALDQMFAKIEKAAQELGWKESGRALVLMKYYHDGQTRKGPGKIPYIVHPLLMACHALAMGLTEDELIATALLHDVLEDSDARPEDLDVSAAVIEAVQLLSFFPPDGMDKKEAKKEYFEHMYSNRIAAIVKLLDRCNNISHMALAFKPDRLKDYIEETEEFVYPLLEYVRQHYPEYHNAVFILKYQMLSVIDSLKKTDLICRGTPVTAR